MKRLMGLVACVVFPILAVAADNPDESFFKKAAEAGVAEVEAGKLAQTKGTTDAVKDFGAMMVKDHGAANAKLKKIADSKGVKLPTEPGMKHKAKQKILEMKDGANFDQAYIDGQIEDHEDTAALLQEEIDSGKDADAKAFASETLPKVKAHLTAVKAIKAGKNSAMSH